MASTSALTPVKKMQLEGKVIAITGANRGICLDIADCCLSTGTSKIYSINIGEIGDEFAAFAAKYPNQLFALPSRRNKKKSPSELQSTRFSQDSWWAAPNRVQCRPIAQAAIDFTTEQIDQLCGINLYGSF